MGGRERIESSTIFVMTGFGQRYNFNGNISADPNSPPKWQAVAQSERFFDSTRERALAARARDRHVPVRDSAGMSLGRARAATDGRRAARSSAAGAARGAQVPRSSAPSASRTAWPSSRSRLADGARRGSRSTRATHLPYWARWIGRRARTLGDVTTRRYFTGYLPFDGYAAADRIMTTIDWRDQVTPMFQVDSYRVSVRSPAAVSGRQWLRRARRAAPRGHAPRRSRTGSGTCASRTAAAAAPSSSSPTTS